MIKRTHYKTPPHSTLPTTHEQVARMGHQQHVLDGANMGLKSHVSKHTSMGKNPSPSGRTRGPVTGSAKASGGNARPMHKATKK